MLHGHLLSLRALRTNSIPTFPKVRGQRSHQHARTPVIEWLMFCFRSSLRVQFSTRCYPAHQGAQSLWNIWRCRNGSGKGLLLLLLYPGPGRERSQVSRDKGSGLVEHDIAVHITTRYEVPSFAHMKRACRVGVLHPASVLSCIKRMNTFIRERTPQIHKYFSTLLHALLRIPTGQMPPRCLSHVVSATVFRCMRAGSQ